ncbi:MAG: hypothetical protein IJO73_04810 [Clostridia bacterium]|nr:hypothetical protein [Clostridia bacterium]
MAYFKIDNTDFSKYVNELKVNSDANYVAQTNAAGDTVVDYVNKKRTIEVGIIPLTSESMSNLQAAIDAFNVSISFRNPLTNELEEGVNCIIPSSGVEYQTIQTNKVMYKAFTL